MKAPSNYPDLACSNCGWVGYEHQLTFPPTILDDDMPDHGGDCPECGEHEIVDHEPVVRFRPTVKDGIGAVLCGLIFLAFIFIASMLGGAK